MLSDLTRSRLVLQHAEVDVVTSLTLKGLVEMVRLKGDRERERERRRPRSLVN